MKYQMAKSQKLILLNKYVTNDKSHFLTKPIEYELQIHRFLGKN